MRIFYRHSLDQRHSLMLFLLMFAIFVSTRMLWVRHSPTAMDAPILASEAYFLVIVLAVYPIIQSILTLGSCDPYFRVRAVKEIGTGRSIWVTQLLTSSLSFTSNRLLLKNFKLMFTSKQATPIFPDKLLLLSRHLEKSLLLPNLSPSEMLCCRL